MLNPWLAFLSTKTRTRLRLQLWLLAFALMPSTAHAHSSISYGDNHDLANLARRAELIVIASVEEVTYVTATFSDQQGQMPVTFVKLNIEKILRGNQQTSQLTLRFMGGSDGMGGFMGVSGVPKFQKGERDVLFVSGNGTQACALTLCEWGRFRILKDRVYNTHGFPLLGLTKKNHVVAFGMPPEPFQVFRYPAPDFDAILKNPVLQKDLPRMMKSSGMSIDEARKEYKANAPPYIEMRTKYDPRDFETSRVELTEGNPNIVPSSTLNQILGRASQNLPPNAGKGEMSLSDFVRTIANLSRGSPRPPRLIESADPAKPVIFKPVQRARGPIPKRVAPPQQKETPAERAWREAEERDPFNPGQKPQGAK